MWTRRQSTETNVISNSMPEPGQRTRSPITGMRAVLVWAQKPSSMALPCDEGSRPGLILPLCYKGCD